MQRLPRAAIISHFVYFVDSLQSLLFAYCTYFLPSSEGDIDDERIPVKFFIISGRLSPIIHDTIFIN